MGRYALQIEFPDTTFSRFKSISEFISNNNERDKERYEEVINSIISLFFKSNVEFYNQTQHFWKIENQMNRIVINKSLEYKRYTYELFQDTLKQIKWSPLIFKQNASIDTCFLVKDIEQFKSVMLLVEQLKLKNLINYLQWKIIFDMFLSIFNDFSTPIFKHDWASKSKMKIDKHNFCHYLTTYYFLGTNLMEEATHSHLNTNFVPLLLLNLKRYKSNFFYTSNILLEATESEVFKVFTERIKNIQINISMNSKYENNVLESFTMKDRKFAKNIFSSYSSMKFQTHSKEELSLSSQTIQFEEQLNTIIIPISYIQKEIFRLSKLSCSNMRILSMKIWEQILKLLNKKYLKIPLEVLSKMSKFPNFSNN